MTNHIDHNRRGQDEHIILAIGYFDAQPDKPTITEFTEYMEPRTTITILPYGLAGANTVHAVGASGAIFGPIPATVLPLISAMPYPPYCGSGFTSIFHPNSFA